MRRVGLVDQLEVELEQMISKGWLPQDGRLPSERTLAELKGISRSTAREALVRLKSRGLIVRHPGRLSRALPLDESLTLENLRVALHGNDAEHPERHVLLGGYFALKRQLTVEVLVACCERASDEALKQLDSACFMLEDVARHREERLAWAWQEFEVLRQAALAARMPGHLLLLQSLERAFHGMASWVLPLLDSQGLQRWARFAYGALSERNSEALKQRLPTFLEACDRPILKALAPVSEAPWAPEPPLHRATVPPPNDEAAPAHGLADARATVPPPAPRPTPGQAVAPLPETAHTQRASLPGTPPQPHESEGATAPEAPPAPGYVCPLSACEEPGQRGDAPQPDADSAGVDPPGALGPNWSDVQASSSQPPPAGAAPPEPSRAAHCGSPDGSRTGALG